ncbi:MAG: hypothetical protein PWR30_218 [Candidatus Woesearchaeota archaeon]|nr:hypothetical protein [Candidatus Woesearchaeota archaeon]
MSDKERDRKIEEILKDVLKEIKPLQRFPEPVLRVKKIINDNIEKEGVDCDCFIGGSVGKNTHLKDDSDCDIFLRFSKEYTEDEIISISKELLKSFNPFVLKGSRNYFSFMLEGIKFEIVPVFRIKKNETASNSVDYSPLHVEWVQKHEKYLDDIRIAKRFCKAQKVYGAESYRKGLSGHSVEILVIFYKGFRNFINAASNWPDKVIIDIENRYKGLNPALLLDESKLGPLILVDPITPNRNAAAAFSKEKFELFKKSCNNFIKNPSRKMFEINYLDAERIKKEFHKRGMITFIFKHEASDLGSQDKTGTRMYKEYERLLKAIKETDITLINSGWDWDPKKEYSWSFFQFKDENLSKYKILRGPPIEFKEASNRFKKAHQNVYEADGCLFAKEERTIRDPVELINFLMKKAFKFPEKTVLFEIVR